jgi:putative DNA primase/helicase
VVQKTDNESIAWMASLKPLEYERVRVEQAKLMGCRPAILDALVKSARHEGSDTDCLPFPEVEPYTEPIDPAQLLSDVSDTIRRFIVLDKEQADAAALWAAFTWFIDVVQVAPLLIINAPEKACGKSQLLDLMGRISYRPLPAANATTAALFRSIELWHPTLLIDECDTFIKENEELKGLINAGYTRSNAFVLRVVGDDHTPKQFSVWGAKALAGIALEKHLPDATMSRAIVLELRRKLSHERVIKMREAEPGLFDGLASKLARFADDCAQQVQHARPNLPDALGDRAQDNWHPLLAIAGCAGSEWLKRATVAALKLSGSGEKSVSSGNELLADIRDVFESKNITKISTSDLIAALVADDEKSWATYNRGREISFRQIATRLAGYGIKSKTIRLKYETAKGFEASQFEDVFARYLADPINLPSQSNISLKPNNYTAFDVTDSVTCDGWKSNTGDHVTDEKVTSNRKVTPKPASTLDCYGVTDKTGGTGALLPTPTPEPSSLWI